MKERVVFLCNNRTHKISYQRGLVKSFENWHENSLKNVYYSVNMDWKYIKPPSPRS